MNQPPSDELTTIRPSYLLEAIIDNIKKLNPHWEIPVRCSWLLLRERIRVTAERTRSYCLSNTSIRFSDSLPTLQDVAVKVLPSAESSSVPVCTVLPSMNTE